MFWKYNRLRRYEENTKKKKNICLEENTWINTEMNKEVMKYINVNKKKKYVKKQ